ncbi:hypothetical protein PIB30_119031 [Stylosanthes scabra]|uniref:RNase H type-1 domain-containing protein n=1 Tax=Stylosanthes scabra TaxID=79078 RepID=A0ABU6Y9T8_9FABA|nr:hypothetical protein [Stylosanthes scabra]
MRGTNRREVTWHAPPQGWLKCNLDASFCKATATGAIAMITRDTNGRVIKGAAGSIQANSALAAEALAIREAMKQAKSHKMERVLFETDNQVLVQAIKSHTINIEIAPILLDIWQLQRELSMVGVTWTPRKGNQLAHEIAKMENLGSLARRGNDQTINRIREIINLESQKARTRASNLQEPLMILAESTISRTVKNQRLVSEIEGFLPNPVEEVRRSSTQLGEDQYANARPEDEMMNVRRCPHQRHSPDERERRQQCITLKGSTQQWRTTAAPSGGVQKQSPSAYQAQQEYYRQDTR